MLWQDVDQAGAAPQDGDFSAASEGRGDDSSSSQSQSEHSSRRAAAAAAASSAYPRDPHGSNEASPLSPRFGSSAGIAASGGGGTARTDHNPNAVYVSDELMYHLYDGDGNGSGKISLRRRHGGKCAPTRSGAAGNGDGDGSDSDDDETPSDRRRAQQQQRNVVLRYFMCLWPPETDEDKARIDQSEWGQKNWFMRLLIKERWTDGSLISLKTDVFSGVTLAVAQVAPSIAFALMAGGPPLVGLFSSFWLGIIPCIFGGRPGQITAIAGAVVVLYPDLVREHGVDAAYAVCLIAGCFILLPGIFRVAGLVRMLPASLMLGFCNGLGISMVMHQIPSFKDEHGDYVTGLRAFYTAIICVISYAVMMLMPYFTSVIPSAFVAIVIGTLLQYIFQLKTVTIGDLYELHGTFPKPMLPNIDWADSSVVSPVMVAAILTAIISCVESFMSDYKIQQLTETPTNFEREAITLGIAHIVNGFFQGMAGCVVFGPCILNIECGSGTRRLSSFICAVLMVIIPIALFAVIRIIPMAALSAVLFGVSSKTADWRMLAMIFLQRISFQESVVALIVTIITVIENLAIGAASGLAAALVFFMWNMSRGKVYITPVLSRPEQENGSRTDAEEQSVPAESRQGDGQAGQSSFAEHAGEVHSRRGVLATDERESTRAGRGEGEKCVDEAPHAEASAQTHDLPIATAVTRSPSVLQTQQQQRFMDVNVLHVEVDPVFPEIKVLRIHLRGVLFFGSCMDFVDSMIKLLRDCHEHIFLKVTDIILDFQHGRMPVMDFSAAEAIFDSANTMARRGIRTHVQNMDPLSYSLFERSRRYFPLVLDDNVNNCKHQCFFRRVFKINSMHETSNVTVPLSSVDPQLLNIPDDLRNSLVGNEGLMLNTSFVQRSGTRQNGDVGGLGLAESGDGSAGVVVNANATINSAGGGDRLADDVFLRANRSFTRSFAEVAITRRGHHQHHHHNNRAGEEAAAAADAAGHHFDPVAKPIDDGGSSSDLAKDGIEMGMVTQTTTDLFEHGGGVDDDTNAAEHDERWHAEAARTKTESKTANPAQAQEELHAFVDTAEGEEGGGGGEMTSVQPMDVRIVVTAHEGETFNKTYSAATSPHGLHSHRLGKLSKNVSTDSFQSSMSASTSAEEVVMLRLVATEEQPALEESIKVGFPIFRPYFGITVPVFATVETWMTQLAEEERAFEAREQQKQQQQQQQQQSREEQDAQHRSGEADRAADGNALRVDGSVVHELDRGVVAARRPFNRQYGDFFFTKVWWRRLFNLDVPPTASIADEAQLALTRQHNADKIRHANEANAVAIRIKEVENQDAKAWSASGLPPTSTPTIPAHPFRLRVREAPTQFIQVPRFPGQGYAKSEVLSHSEVVRMKRIVCRRLFQEETSQEMACFPARMKKFEVDLMDGFI